MTVYNLPSLLPVNMNTIELVIYSAFSVKWLFYFVVSECRKACGCWREHFTVKFYIYTLWLAFFLILFFNKNTVLCTQDPGPIFSRVRAVN